VYRKGWVDVSDMIFWAMAGAMTLAVATILLIALRRGGRDLDLRAAEFDARVYRDQLREIEREQARGIVTEEEAGRMRAEVARRLLEADKAIVAQTTATPDPGTSPGTSPGTVGGPAIAAVIVACLLSGGGIYVWLGAPGYPDLPLQVRVQMAEERRAERPSQTQMEESLPPSPPVAGLDPEFMRLVEQLRETVANRPDDLQGQQLLARNEANVGDFAAARRAQARVIELKGAEATHQDWLLLATLMIQAAGGQVSPDAESILLRVMREDPRNDTALFFAGILNMQVGRHDLAFRFWRQLLDTAPPESPWRGDVRGRIEELAQIAGVRYELPPEDAERGPTAADMEAAADLSPEERAQMIRGMVEGLNTRLATEGGTAQDWGRLIIALAQLGERERATSIFAEAVGTFYGRDSDLSLLYEAARQAGISQ